MLLDAIDRAVAENSRLGGEHRGRLDTTKIAVMGQSCGGIETCEVAGDPRLTTVALWNGGLLRDSQNYLLQRLRTQGPVRGRRVRAVRHRVGRDAQEPRLTPGRAVPGSAVTPRGHPGRAAPRVRHPA
ncbi:hypothetical protein ACFV4N_36005 [Actinosynnema sp. NPDC059797]